MRLFPLGQLFNSKGKRLGDVRGIESYEFAYTPLSRAWQDIYIDGIVYVPVHPTLPEQDLVAGRDGCAIKGFTKGTI